MAIKVCLGGTFNVIHAGHIALLSRAFSEGDEVYIGLTADSMARAGRGVPVKKYSVRLAGLRQTLEAVSGGKPFRIFPLEDRMGPAASEDYDAIVVSRETESGALEINRARTEKGLKSLRVIILEMVLASDGKPISSTRVLRGEISAADGDNP